MNDAAMANVVTLLVVDDNPLDRTLLAASLEGEGYVVVTVNSGVQALEMLRAQSFDIVLLDLLMPEMNGFEVLERMQADSALQHVPVIVVSSENDMDSVVRCIEMGATDYLTKPFDPVLLRVRINTSLTLRRLRDQAQYAGRLLVVDDDAINRMLLTASLEDEGYTIEEAQDGQEALVKLREQAFDVVLLDLLMPGMNGFEVLERMKADSALQHIPVIVVSAADDMRDIVRCIEMGATDHLTKPFDPTLLRARLNASLAAKQLHDQEQAYLEMVRNERQQAERLLLNVLPKPVADRLKLGEDVIADSFEDVTVMFVDIVNFTPLAAQMSPKALVSLLNEIFSLFDELAARHGLEKIKTIGDAYMVVGGLPTPRADHVAAMAEMALDVQQSLVALNTEGGIAERCPCSELSVRIGFHAGPVVAGVIGRHKFIYDLWGDTVNIASRMASHGIPDSIQVTEACHARLKGRYEFEERGAIEVKGKGAMTTYLLTGRKAAGRG